MSKELSVTSALKLGIEAHKSGRVQDADRYYSAVLEVEPDHPDANHNMGILAVGIGKIEQALLFFERAFHVRTFS